MNPLLRALGPITAGAGYSALLDRLSYGSYDKDSMSERRGLNALFNGLLGAGGTKLLTSGHGPTGVSMMAAAPVKDVALAAMKPLHDIGKQVKSKTRSENARTALYSLLGIGALGVGASSVYNASERHKERKDNAGQITVTLPTKNPGDAETQVTLPLVRGKLPKSILTQIDRDVKRRMRAGGKERTLHRN